MMTLREIVGVAAARQEGNTGNKEEVLGSVELAFTALVNTPYFFTMVQTLRWIL